jgi:uncharacterized protein
MNRRALACLVLPVLVAGAATAASAQQATEIRWGTSQVGSSGHRAVTTLADLLNREWDGYSVIVQPTPGAIVSVKGYATGQFEGYYGSDIAFYEYANDANRFEGFKANATKEPVQSFWAFTIEVGLGVHADSRDEYDEWRDLSGRRVFTGPQPWDTRAQIERALDALGVEHEYVEVDLSTVGSLLDQGQLAAFGIYASGESSTAPWIVETSLTTDWVPLEPSEEELSLLREAGFNPVEVDAGVFEEDFGDVGRVTLLPFYYGLHVGLEVPEEDVYRMLQVIEQNLDSLAEGDPAFSQIKEDMVGMQRRGIESSVEFVPIHPGLARYMREKGAWNEAWDDRIATAG